MGWTGIPSITNPPVLIKEVPVYLDMIAKLYEQWDAEELEMSGKDEEFITSLAERIQESDDPTNYPISEAQEEWIQDCWDRYTEK